MPELTVANMVGAEFGNEDRIEPGHLQRLARPPDLDRRQLWGSREDRTPAPGPDHPKAYAETTMTSPTLQREGRFSVGLA